MRYALLVIAIIGCCSGCAASYRDAHARTPGQATDDVAIGAKVKARLLADGSVSGLRINVDVSQRIVTLRGKVPSKPLIERAIVLARTVKGVTSVRNELSLR